MLASHTNNNPLALIIEDDEDAAILIEDALAEAGFNTELIQDGRAALDRLETTTPALIALDMHLPRMSGVDILTHIRCTERLALIPVMVITADGHLAQRIESEANLVLLKPASFSQMYRLAKRLKDRDTIFPWKG